MAEGKKAFLVYVNWKLWLDGLSNEQKGIWLNWMMDYCNDTYPEYPQDQAVKIACMMAQDQLKRDLKKYELKVESIKRAREQREKNNNQNDINMKSNSNQDDISSVNDNVNVKVKDIVLSNDNINNIQDTNVSSVEVKNFILELPTILSAKGNKFPIFQEDIDKWQAVYIGVDVLTELKKMKLWLEANPKSKKTYQGIPRFVNNWLSREQDKASRTFKNYSVGNVSDDDGGFMEL